MKALLNAVVCFVIGHEDQPEIVPHFGIRAKCTRCARTTTGLRNHARPGDTAMHAVSADARLGFELSQIAASIAALIHRADALRGVAPDLAFIRLDLPMRRHYLALGEKVVLLRQGAHDITVGVDQHRQKAKDALRAIQENRAFCLVPKRPATQEASK